MNVCKFCGAKRAEAAFHSYMAAYYCGSWHDGSRHWSQGIACRDRCEKIRVHLEQTIETLQRRIAKAVAALKTIDRYSIEGVYDFGAIGKYDYGGDWVHFEDLDAVRDILQGNSPEIPEGST